MTHIVEVIFGDIDWETIPEVGCYGVVEATHVDDIQWVSNFELGSHAVEEWLVA